MNPFQLLAEAFLQMLVALIAWLIRFFTGPRPGAIALAAWEYVQALMVIIGLVTANLVFWNVVAGVLGYNGYVREARIVLLIIAWTLLPLLIVLVGGTGFAADLLINGLRKKPKSKEEAKEIFRGFLGLPLWLLVITEVMLVLGVYAPAEAFALGPLGAMGLVLLSFIRKWKFVIGWQLASALQVAFITFALLASVPARFWEGTVGYNLRPVFQLAWSPAVDERVRDAFRADIVETEGKDATEELKQLREKYRLAGSAAERLKIKQEFAVLEASRATGLKQGIERLRSTITK